MLDDGALEGPDDRAFHLGDEEPVVGILADGLQGSLVARIELGIGLVPVAG